MNTHQNNPFRIRNIYPNNLSNKSIDSKAKSPRQSNQTFLLFLTSFSSFDKRGTRVCNVPLIARTNSCIEHSVGSYHQADNDG